MSKVDLRLDWATHKAAAYACKNWHYSKSFPTPPYVRIGVWELERFVGVVIFSRGANDNLLRPYGLMRDQGAEITRVALRSHDAPVSRIVSVSMKMLRMKAPRLRLIISFADPVHHHHGGIYQAGNWIYSGQTSSDVRYKAPTGKWYHSRMVSASGFKTQYGERRKVWRPEECFAVKIPGKHRYLMPLDAEMRAQIEPLRKPYPKREKHAMTGPPEQRRGSTDPHAPGEAHVS